MDQASKARRLAELHTQGAPLVLYNVWDAGSANAVAKAGASAIATSSWEVAKAHGYEDGQDIPLKFAESILARIAASVDLPVSADFEGGYTEDDAELADNTSRLLDAGIVGINFEDQIISGSDLYDIDRQAVRIATIRGAADEEGIPLFINARTDLFLGRGNDPESTVDAALARASAYAAAGASSFFIPGLQEEHLIARICEGVSLPVNVMVMDGVPSTERLAEIGVRRISYGPIPFINTMKTLELEAAKLF
ncbi:isocitrate lyase/phosphoenolpyruvate mutase family protein [Mycobacterium sp. 1245852.3]|uniref:isocitrate lyase/PEP mutase family protein n=1 Tax=Mycobacterium sp. 1245852.3 TaxID=1856860 RepID=UPI0007FE96F4|nr:isocitrate lyase/phosphoenolpyruvate mutase family protein [Mycobacterium sp. 1245852.3]OBJ83257.1 phosphonomutase [Mycobacterium sp. 1245852.3]